MSTNDHFREKDEGYESAMIQTKLPSKDKKSKDNPHEHVERKRIVLDTKRLPSKANTTGSLRGRRNVILDTKVKHIWRQSLGKSIQNP